MIVDVNDTHEYDYDVLYQLTDVNYPDSSSRTYYYDALGNRYSVTNGGSTTYISNSLNQYDYVGSADYDYDDNGNLTGIDAEDDGDYEVEYVYDCENRLIEVKEDGQTTAEYEYDFKGRRIKKTVYGQTTVITKYVYDGDQVIAEYNGFGELLRKFVYGPGIDEPVCMIDVSDNDAEYYYQFDGLGSVIALSDEDASLVENYSYDVFGEPAIYDANDQVLTASAYDNPYMFTGRRFDDESDLYYYRARYYAYDVGRFLQVDPLRYISGLNLYDYVHNNPVLLGDPYGLCTSGGYALSEIEYDVKTEGFCPPFTEAIGKNKVEKMLNNYKKRSFDTCPAGKKCTGGSTSTLSERFRVQYSDSFWWFPWFPSPDPGLIVWFKCTIKASGSATVTAYLRVGGECCAE